MRVGERYGKHWGQVIRGCFYPFPKAFTEVADAILWLPIGAVTDLMGKRLLRGLHLNALNAQGRAIVSESGPHGST